jgi:hypothetical protein
MIKYSHVRLLILCDEKGVEEISQHLGIGPAEVKSSDSGNPPPTGLTHVWCFDSPKSTDCEPTTRLESLADAIEPFADKLLSLDSRYPRFIDIVYHTTPQHVGGITGEFDWFRCPAPLMSRLGRWNLDLSYETFWFDHPEWERLRLPWWRRILRAFQ